MNLDSTAEIWKTLENRFQSSNRSKVIQLKNALHHISLKNSTMTQYLTEIKTLVDQIVAVGSQVDPEDIILHTLNGLHSTYQSFKTSIRTMLHPVSLDNLYSLLLSEEVNQAFKATRLTDSSDPNLALYTSRGRGRRGKGRPSSNQADGSKRPPTASITCQICFKKGHTASSCWHLMNANYTPQVPQHTSKAMVADSNSAFTDWYLDSGASSHLTNSLDNLSISTPYHGTDGITIGDGSSVNIAHSGKGLLLTPSRPEDTLTSSARNMP